MRRGGGAALLALPVCFLLAELLLRHHALPYFLWDNLDPSYVYLLNGISILEGVPPGHVDHPGTPVQSLMALLIWLSGRGVPGAVDRSAFLQAESLLTLCSTVILALDTLALLLLGWVVRRRFGALLPALLAQTTPFLTMLTLKHGIEVEPEPMLLLGVLLLAIAMVEEVAEPRAAARMKAAGVMGFATACKITFAPLGLAPLLLIVGWRRRLVFVAACALALIVFLIPALASWRHMLHWFGGVALANGTYGAGADTVIDVARYPHAFIKLFFARPIFLLVYAGSVAALVIRHRQAGPLSPAGRALFGIVMAQLAQILLVAKHPSAHYILPALEMSGPAMAFLWLVAREIEMPPLPRRRLDRGFAGLLAVLIVAQGIAFVGQDREMRREQAGALSIDMDRAFPRCAHLYVDRASAPSAAWFYGAIYGAPAYLSRIAPFLPADDYFYESWRGRFENLGGEIAPAAIAARYPCLALRGIDLDTLRGLAIGFGPAFAQAETCTAGSEHILVAGAACPAK